MTSFGWKGKCKYGSFRQWTNAGCAGKTVRSLESACHTLEVCSRQGAIQIHVYLYLTLLTSDTRTSFDSSEIEASGSKHKQTLTICGSDGEHDMRPLL